MILSAYWTVVKLRDDNEHTACEISSNHSLLTLEFPNKLSFITLPANCPILLKLMAAIVMKGK